MNTIRAVGLLPRFFPWCFAVVVLAASPAWAVDEGGTNRFSDDFSAESLDGWFVREGDWKIEDGQAVAAGRFGVLLRKAVRVEDCEAAADVAYIHSEPHAAAGIVFRFSDDGTGFAAGVREIENGVHPQFGRWERPVVQLFRCDRDGWKLLQESKVQRCRSGEMGRLKVICRGPNIWIFYGDMDRPILSEYEPEHVRAGAVGLWKDHLGSGCYDRFRFGPPPDRLPAEPSRTDWSWVRGAVYVRSNAVNSVEMWHDYWDHTAIVDRELGYAALYGFNMVQAYLHWIVWDRHGEEYLRRIDDFLARAARHGLKANLIFWDDCGHVEPSLRFAAPVPGRHNSQMMPNPSHRIRDSREEFAAHQQRFGAYVRAIAGRFKDDKRIAFWQLYNEAMGPKENYRDGTGDANINRLLERTRDWVKQAGACQPVTATGGGFYGPQYSDFYSYHSYRFGTIPLPGADGGPEHICTETLNRPDTLLTDCVRQFGAKRNGFVIWELMIGRDNCRFPWGHPDGPAEPAAPFHGVIYPDGHPWDVAEIKALLGDERFAAMKRRCFEVEYFDGEFRARRKSSITPQIDFDLSDGAGYGSPDASVGLGEDDFSMRWTGQWRVPASGRHQFVVDTDGVFRLWVGTSKLIDKPDHARREASGEIALTKGDIVSLKMEYTHRRGTASAHLYCVGPDGSKRVLTLD